MFAIIKSLLFILFTLTGSFAVYVFWGPPLGIVAFITGIFLIFATNTWFQNINSYIASFSIFRVLSALYGIGAIGLSLFLFFALQNAALFSTVQSDNPVLAKLMIMKGLDVNAPLPYWPKGTPEHIVEHSVCRITTPIEMASAAGAPKVAQILIDNGAQVNEGACNPLVVAVVERQYDMVKLLLENGADPNMLSGAGIMKTAKTMPPLAYALQYHGASYRPAGVNPYKVAKVRIDNTDTIKLLLENGASPNRKYPPKEYYRVKRNEFDLPLYDAVRASYVTPDIIKLLLDHGADPTIEMKGRPIYELVERFESGGLSREQHAEIARMLKAAAGKR